MVCSTEPVSYTHLKLLEIKGVGIRTVSGFLAEVGDISRFNNPKELQKLAGLALVENSSGKHKGETTISRRGRKRLRYLLFEVAMSLVAKNPEFRELHNYYTTRKPVSYTHLDVYKRQSHTSGRD